MLSVWARNKLQGLWRQEVKLLAALYCRASSVGPCAAELPPLQYRHCRPRRAGRVSDRRGSVRVVRPE